MFEPRAIPPTDADLLCLLATAGMGWKLHGSSAHRPGSRGIPHAWKWNRDRLRIMVYIGGDGDGANVEFDPLNDPASANELVTRLKTKEIDVTGWDLGTPDGRRRMCEAAKEKIDAAAKPVHHETAAIPAVEGTAPQPPVIREAEHA
jgi:hypothetical protein